MLVGVPDKSTAGSCGAGSGGIGAGNEVRGSEVWDDDERGGAALSCLGGLCSSANMLGVGRWMTGSGVTAGGRIRGAAASDLEREVEACLEAISEGPFTAGFRAVVAKVRWRGASETIRRPGIGRPAGTWVVKVGLDSNGGEGVVESAADDSTRRSLSFIAFNWISRLRCALCNLGEISDFDLKRRKPNLLCDLFTLRS